MVWTWFATGWTYALLLPPTLLLPTALGRRDDPVLRAATWVGSAAIVLALAGFLRWVFVVPPLARQYMAGDTTTRAAVDAAWLAQHQLGGALLGEHLGQTLAIAWSTTISVIILRRRLLPAAVGMLGLVASAIYLLNQGDILTTAIPGVPAWESAGFLGSTLWWSMDRHPRLRAPAPASTQPTPQNRLCPAASRCRAAGLPGCRFSLE
ncbi:DUF4386 domain-containing protein [Frankia sp. CgS1]